MPYKCGSYQMIEKKIIAAGIYSFTVLCPEIAEIAKPGQFVHVRAEGFTLRRPISICDVSQKNGTLRLVFEVRGDGTRKISEKTVGEELDMIAPLGNGFTVQGGYSDLAVAVVGGGIGVPPLLYTAKALTENGADVTAILGFRSHDKVILQGDFKQFGINTVVCTDDGSLGVHGTVAVPLAEAIEKNGIKAVFACGPAPMLKSVVKICGDFGIECEVSLEERMGCGVGACAVCVCGVKNAENNVEMKRVCRDGPVFNGKDAVL